MSFCLMLAFDLLYSWYRKPLNSTPCQLMFFIHGTLNPEQHPLSINVLYSCTLNPEQHPLSINVRYSWYRKSWTVSLEIEGWGRPLKIFLLNKPFQQNNWRYSSSISLLNRITGFTGKLGTLIILVPKDITSNIYRFVTRPGVVWCMPTGLYINTVWAHNMITLTWLKSWYNASITIWLVWRTRQLLDVPCTVCILELYLFVLGRWVWFGNSPYEEVWIRIILFTSFPYKLGRTIKRKTSVFCSRTE